MAMSPAERQKLYRERKKDGCQIVPLAVDQGVVEGLVASGDLDREDMGDTEKIAAALLRNARRQTV